MGNEFFFVVNATGRIGRHPGLTYLRRGLVVCHRSRPGVREGRHAIPGEVGGTRRDLKNPMRVYSPRAARGARVFDRLCVRGTPGEQ